VSCVDHMNKYIVQKLQEFTVQGMKSVTIICKTAKQCEEVYNSIKNDIKSINLITSESTRLTSGISIIPSYLTKGLEFDAVIIYDASNMNYNGEEQRKLMYTMCTRALHKLCITYSGKLTELMQNVSEELCDFLEV